MKATPRQERPPLRPALPTFSFTQADELANTTGGAVPAALLQSHCAPATYAVLISGQVQRFTWKDGTGPLLAAADPACPPVVDVYIVLQEGEMGGIWRGPIPDTPYQADTTADNLQDWYRNRGARHVSVEYVSAADMRAYLDKAPFPHERLWWRSSNKSDEQGPLNDQGGRYRNNLKMLYLRHLAFAAAVASEQSYDGFTYWRDDNFFFTPLPEALIPVAGPKPEVVVDNNCGWGSYSDKIYASNPAGAAVLFDLTLDDFFAKMEDFAACGGNDAKTPCWDREVGADPVHLDGDWQTEAFLTDVMAAASVTVTKRELHRADVRYVQGHEGLCVPGQYWGCTLDGYLNTSLNADHGIQCCTGDAKCDYSPGTEARYAAWREW